MQFFQSRFLHVALTALIAASVAGCATIKQPTQPEFSQTPLDPFVWRYDEVEDHFVHNQSGTVIPPQIAGFNLYDLRVYDDGIGNDVSAGYGRKTAAGDVVLTLYIGRFPDISFHQYLDASRREVERVHHATADSPGQIYLLLADGALKALRQQVFHLDSWQGKPTPYSSHLFFARFGEWIVKIRFSFPAATSEDSITDLNTFIREFSWPEELYDTNDVDRRQQLIAELELEALFQDENYGLAQERLEKHLEEHREGPEIINLAASVALANNDPKAAAKFILASQTTLSPSEFNRIDNRLVAKVRAGLARLEEDADEFGFLSKLTSADYRGADPAAGSGYIYERFAELLADRDDNDGALDQLDRVYLASDLKTVFVDKKWKWLWEKLGDREETVINSLASIELGFAMDEMARLPSSVSAVTFLVQSLRQKGDFEEAAETARKALANSEKYQGSMEDWLWLLNERAYALEEAGNSDQALEVFSNIDRFSLDEYGSLVNQIINYAEMLTRQGKYEESERQLARLAPTGSASKYGYMWVKAIRVCNATMTEDPGAADLIIDDMKSNDESNYAAMMMAYLCQNDRKDAIALAVSRLNDEDERASMLLALSSYKPLPKQSELQHEILQRLGEIAQAPEVRAAAEGAGELRDFAFYRGYWGSF